MKCDDMKKEENNENNNKEGMNNNEEGVRVLKPGKGGARGHITRLDESKNKSIAHF